MSSASLLLEKRRRARMGKIMKEVEFY